MIISRRSFLIGSTLGVVASPHIARPVTYKDAAGREIPVPARIDRVFPAGPPAAIHQYAIGPQQLLGWPRANRPDELAYLLSDVGARPEVGRLTGRGNTTNLETLLSLKPDIIIDIGSTSRPFAETAARIQSQTGIPYVLFDGRFESLLSTLRFHGQIVGQEKQSERLIAFASDILKTVQSRILGVPQDMRPRVYYARGPKGLETALGNSINVETLDYVGAVNVAAEVKGGLTLVSLEQVIAWNPDVIVTIDREFAERVRIDPNWRSIKAVQQGRVHLSPKMPFGWVDFPPALNRLPGLWWLGSIFYPQIFPESLIPLTRDFYSLFYHRVPSDQQIADVLAGRG